MLKTLDTQNTALIQLSDAQAACLASVASQIDALNASMRSAVAAGMTIELRRTSRHHQDDGCWGDIIAPSIVKTA
jgi:hypothetical protein